jgi:hypothetical protein
MGWTLPGGIECAKVVQHESKALSGARNLNNGILVNKPGSPTSSEFKSVEPQTFETRQKINKTI